MPRRRWLIAGVILVLLIGVLVAGRSAARLLSVPVRHRRARPTCRKSPLDDDPYVAPLPRPPEELLQRSASRRARTAAQPERPRGRSGPPPDDVVSAVRAAVTGSNVHPT